MSLRPTEKKRDGFCSLIKPEVRLPELRGVASPFSLAPSWPCCQSVFSTAAVGASLCILDDNHIALKLEHATILSLLVYFVSIRY